ncbi:MAG: hypothetical protein A07HR60_01477 [uncultured archaeon A07HR60]|nr:MAG: hypothetical protein A07HR60_01477 [uncultured archaeon A07HR60]
MPGRGVTAAWPRQQSGHADWTANLTLPTKRDGAVGIQRLQSLEEVNSWLMAVCRLRLAKSQRPRRVISDLDSQRPIPMAVGITAVARRKPTSWLRGVKPTLLTTPRYCLLRQECYSYPVVNFISSRGGSAAQWNRIISGIRLPLRLTDPPVDRWCGFQTRR